MITFRRPLAARKASFPVKNVANSISSAICVENEPKYRFVLDVRRRRRWCVRAGGWLVIASRRRLSNQRDERAGELVAREAAHLPPPPSKSNVAGITIASVADKFSITLGAHRTRFPPPASRPRAICHSTSTSFVSTRFHRRTFSLYKRIKLVSHTLNNGEFAVCSLGGRNVKTTLANFYPNHKNIKTEKNTPQKIMCINMTLCLCAIPGFRMKSNATFSFRFVCGVCFYDFW